MPTLSSPAFSLPTFNDPTLQKALAEHGHIIDRHRESLDAITADIKALESYLQASGVRVAVSIPFEEQVNEYGDTEYYHIAWTGDDEKKWRVVYQRRGESGSALDETPLLEAPIRVRIAASWKLSELLVQVAEAIKTRGIDRPTASAAAANKAKRPKPATSPIDDVGMDDIPF